MGRNSWERSGVEPTTLPLAAVDRKHYNMSKSLNIFLFRFRK
jgi:hypothetical protein